MSSKKPPVEFEHHFFNRSDLFMTPLIVCKWNTDIEYSIVIKSLNKTCTSCQLHPESREASVTPKSPWPLRVSPAQFHSFFDPVRKFPDDPSLHVTSGCCWGCLIYPVQKTSLPMMQIFLKIPSFFQSTNRCQNKSYKKAAQTLLSVSHIFCTDLNFGVWDKFDSNIERILRHWCLYYIEKGAQIY